MSSFSDRLEQINSEHNALITRVNEAENNNYNRKYAVVVRVERNDRESFFTVAESPNGIDNFKFWDFPILLSETHLKMN